MSNPAPVESEPGVTPGAPAVPGPGPGPESAATAMPNSTVTGLRASLKTIGGNSIVYFLAQAGVTAATMIVTPLYTHAMSPRDYGILALAATASMVVTLVLSLQLDSAIGRMTVEYKTDAERRALMGTILIFLLAGGLVTAIVLEVAGGLGYLNVFRGVPYSPYLRYALWSGYLAIFPFLPIALYTLRGEARKVLRLRYLTIGVQIGTGITLIVIFHQGAIGALRAILAGAVVSAIVAVVLMARHASLRFSRPLLMASLAFSLPVIPHSIANWVLQLSDRFVLQNYVDNAQLGLYQLGYLVGGAAALFTNAAASALAPLFYWRLRDEKASTQVPALGTYILLGLTVACVLLAVYGGTLILLLTPASYHHAVVIVPWIAASYIFVSAYLLQSYATWYVMRTRQLALGTLAAAVINIGATFLFGSLFGIVGAGIATVIGYAALALIQGLIAKQLYPIAWEYLRWFKIAVVAGACLAGCLVIGDAATPVSILERAAVLAAGFPLGLELLRFWTPTEQTELRGLVRSLGAGAARRAGGR
ncbi:MAG: lipopolysaccharide biosynthesis protein [Solirubrobacteraceae bacterium]